VAFQVVIERNFDGMFDLPLKSDVYCKASLLTVKSSSRLRQLSDLGESKRTRCIKGKLKYFSIVDEKLKSDVYCKASLIAA
jgi:hypothetical protein